MDRPIEVELEWTGAERFTVTAPGHALELDGESGSGPSPMQWMAAGIGGCMGIDVVLILEKMRTPAQALHVRVVGERPAEPPRRFDALLLEFDVRGDVPQGNLDRAIALSRDKYCSAMASLREGTEIRIEARVSPTRSA